MINMYTQNIIPLFVWAIVSYILCDLFRFILRLPRFGKFHTLILSIPLVFLPTLAFVYLFPYRGTLSGSIPIELFFSSIFGVIVYLLGFSIFIVYKVAAKRNFIYCQALFLISSIYMIFHMVNNIPRPLIN